MRVLVLGIGNVMFGDEGVGVHFVKMMEANYKFSHETDELKFIDGGTLALTLTPLIAEAGRLIVIDCISAEGAEVGDVYLFPYEKMPASVSWNGSAHEVEMLETLRLMELTGDLPSTQILGIVPKRIEPMSFELSNEILKGVNLMQNVLLKELERLNFRCEKVANFSVVDMAHEWQKGVKR